MKQNQSFTKARAEAEAQDYEEISPEEPMCKRNTFCHILGALALSGLIVVIATIAVAMFTGN